MALPLCWSSDFRILSDESVIVMISETQFARGFKQLVADRDAQTFCGYRIKEIHSNPRVLQCYDNARGRIGIALRLLPDDDPPEELPPDSDKAVISLVEVQGKGALLLATRANRCRERTFLGIAREITNHFLINGDDSIAGFTAAIKEWIPESKQAPPFTYKKQAGLMGELFVLEHDLLPNFSTRECIAFWRGPMGGAKDYVLPRCCIEVKATKASDAHLFWVSNDDQFLIPETRPMFLRYINFLEDQSDSESVPQAVERIRTQLATDPAVERDFMALVRQSGYNPRHKRKYNLARFTRSSDYFFEVTGAFPRLLLGNVQKGVNAPFLAGLKYAISVDALRKQFELKPPAKRYWQALKRTT